MRINLSLIKKINFNYSFGKEQISSIFKTSISTLGIPVFVYFKIGNPRPFIVNVLNFDGLD
jgi:hypothetical protein